jgi:excisionase family DNA binding protein
VSGPRYLTIAQAAELLQLDPHTIYRWIALRRLPVVRLSPRAVRVRAVDLDGYLASQLQRALAKFALPGLPEDAVEGEP